MTVEINWQQKKLESVEKDVIFVTKKRDLVKIGDIIYWGTDSNRLIVKNIEN